MAKKKKQKQALNHSSDTQRQDDMHPCQNQLESWTVKGSNSTGIKRHKEKFSFGQENGLSTEGFGQPWKQLVENHPIDSKIRHAVNLRQGHVPMAFKPAKDDSMRGKKRIKDRRLIPRIQEYLDTRTSKKIASVPLMAEYLQNKYPEYSRRNRSVFTQYVKKAYSHMDIQGGNQSSSSELSDSDTDGTNHRHEDGKTSKKKRKVQPSDEDEKSDVEEILVQYKDTNAINSMMSGMYKNSSWHSADNTIERGDNKSTLVSNSHANRHDNLSGLVRTQETLGECYFIDKQGNGSTIPKSNRCEPPDLDQPDSFIQKYDSPSTTLHEDSVKCDSNSIHLHKKLIQAPTVSAKSPAEKAFGNISDVTDAHSSMSNNVICDRNEEEIVIDSDSEEVSIQNSACTKSDNVVKQRETSTPRRIKKQKVSAKLKKTTDESKSTDSKEVGPVLQKSTVTFADIGGNEQSLVEICKLLVHMKHPEVYQQLGVTPPRGFLLHGPPGCGKTLLANAIAGELDLPMVKIAATEIVSGVSGDSEEKVRELFEKATLSAPCVLFIDEVDAITPKRETASKDMERRIVSQLLTCMDDLNKNTEAHVLVIGATNRPDSLDPALRRAGRFDKEICLGIPDENSRKRILEVLCRNLRLIPGFDFAYLARFTPGFVGADLMSLTREAAMVAVNRVFKDLQKSGASDTNTQTENRQNCEQQIRSCDQTVETELSDNTDTDMLSASRNSIDEKTAPSSHFMKSDSDLLQNDISDLSVSKYEICSTTSDMNKTDTEILQDSDNYQREVNKNSTLNVESIPVSEITHTSRLDNQLSIDICSLSHKGIEDRDTLVTQEGCVTDENVNLNGANLSSEGQDKTVEETELSSVLSWLKDQPPLTEEQLRDLFVTLDDFKNALSSVQPSAKREGFATVPDVTWDDIGALHNVREELQLAILAPVRHPKEFKALGLNRAQGILLAGPPGCGKTLLAKAVANESGINFISVKGPELLNMYVGESEKAVRTVFQRARNSSPCVIFFDELDALCPRRSSSADGGSSTRVVNQLLTEMDGLEERKQVFIMAATNRPDIIDPAVLRPGRLDKTLYVGLPSMSDRLDILRCITKSGSQPLLAKDVDMDMIAGDQRCENYTGADLAALVREASVSALKEAISQTNRSAGVPIAVNNHHFEAAFKKIKPSVSVKDRDRYISMESKLATE